MSDNRQQNPWIPAQSGIFSGFNIVSILQLLLMGFGAYFLFTKGKDILGKFTTSGSGKTSEMPKHN